MIRKAVNLKNGSGRDLNKLFFKDLGFGMLLLVHLITGGSFGRVFFFTVSPPSAGEYCLKQKTKQTDAGFLLLTLFNSSSVAPSSSLTLVFLSPVGYLAGAKSHDCFRKTC